VFPVDGYENNDNMWDLIMNIFPAPSNNGQQSGTNNLANYGTVQYFDQRKQQQQQMRQQQNNKQQ